MTAMELLYGQMFAALEEACIGLALVLRQAAASGEAEDEEDEGPP